jgi:hypothetical protein
LAALALMEAASAPPLTGGGTMLCAVLLVALLAALPAAPSLSAQDVQRDILAGRVTGPGGDRVAGAVVSVVAAGAAAGTRPQTARTDNEGRWLIAVQEGPGEYVVRVNMIGMAPAQATATRTLPRTPILVNFRLEPVPVTLAEVNVVARHRPRPPREIVAADQASAEVETNTHFAGAIAMADRGNLATMAASANGVTLLPDAGGGPPSFSVLGLSADQNRVTLNGAQFGGGDIPRDAIVGTAVAPTSYDVSRGGFSGGQLAITAYPGGNFYNRMAHLTLDAPSLQWTDAVGRQTGQQYTNVQVSGTAAGPIVWNRVFYSVSAQLGRRSSDLRSLLADDPFALQRVGVAHDSVTRLVTALALNGLPLTSGRVSSGRETDNASLLARLDWAPSQTVATNLVVSARHSRSTASFLGLTAVPGHGGSVNTTGVDVTATLSAYLPGNYLNDLRLGVRSNVSASDPYLELPDVRVRVSSVFSDSTTGTTSLQLGGNPALPRGVRNSGAELSDQLSWLSLDRKHRVRATLNVRTDAFSQDQYSNRRGTYTFNSIADFEANRPASFSRVFAGRKASASALTGAMSVGDEWRPNSRVQVLYGVRVDANRFADRPAYNPAVDSIFRVRTDFAPRLVDVSPRVGFWWGFGTNGMTGIPGFGAPWGRIRGGIGSFRNDVAPTLIAPAMVASGLPDGVRQINCIGAAVPLPDWNAMVSDPSSIPTSCADTASTSPFASTAPNVWLVDRRYAAQKSWRGNLEFEGVLIPRRFGFQVGVIYSTNLHQQAPLDLNFAPSQRFALAAEGGRPVYANAASIVPATGALTNRDSRRDPQFGSVTALMTDLRSESRQIIVSLFPQRGTNLGRFTYMNLSYVNTRVHDQARGFGGTTAGNPLDVVWGRSAQDVRHQFNVRILATRVGTLFSIWTAMRIASGTPFTPMVGGDINGDGLANDRAFVFGPASGDSAVGAGMAALVAGASPRLRDCLRRQEGHIAARNSCEGPWTGTMNAQLIVNPERLGFDNRVQLSLSFANVFAGVDQLLHGDAQLLGWGQAGVADPVLLTVRGFDPATGRFRYEVNPRFGDTRPSRVGVRAPMVVTLEARIQLGRPGNRQFVEQMLAPGRSRRGERLMVPQVKDRLLSTVFNPVRALGQAKDSLSVLTVAQVEQLTLLDRRVSAQLDSVATPWAQSVAALPATTNEDEVDRRLLITRQALFDVIVDGMRQAGTIFTPEQIEEFPPGLRVAFNINRLLAARPFTGFFANY